MHCLVFTDTDLYSHTKGKIYLANQRWGRSTCLRDQCYDVDCHPWLSRGLNQSEYTLILCTYKCLCNFLHSIRPPDKSAYWKPISFISHPKHMLWVLKRTISMRQFFGHPKRMHKIRKYLSIYVHKISLSGSMFHISYVPHIKR